MARPWMIWGGSYRFTRIPSHVSVRYRFALVKVRRPSNSLILLVACPALYCPLLPFTALCCLLLSFTCPLLPCTALHCLLLPFTCPLRPFTALYCPSLPFAALISHAKFRHKCRGCAKMSQQMIFVDRIAFGGVLSFSQEIGKIRHSTVTLLLTTITEVLTDAQTWREMVEAAWSKLPSLHVQDWCRHPSLHIQDDSLS